MISNKSGIFEINARNLLCPLPVIRVQDAIKTLPSFSKVKVIATDPGVKYDIPAWCKVHGHSILSIDDVEREIVILIQVGERHER